MKKLLLVGVVGLSALLYGCGGSSDCEEVIPPAPEPEITFPNNQAPDYVIREADEIGFARVLGEGFYTGQVLGIDVKESGFPRVVVQEFIADYGNGYLTKPTSNVQEVSANFFTKAGNIEVMLSKEDITSLQDQLLTVVDRGGKKNEVTGEYVAKFYISTPVLGHFTDYDGEYALINHVKYPVKHVDPKLLNGSSYVAGYWEGDKLNLFATSYSGRAYGFSHEVKVHRILGQTDFTYLDSDNNEVTVILKQLGQTVAPSDCVKVVDEELKEGEKVVITGFEVNYSTMEVKDATVFKSE